MYSLYRSPGQAHVDGQPLTFNNWVPARGPTGKRNVVDGFLCCFVDSAIDVGTAVIQGEDCARIFARVRIEQIDGRVRWDTRGDAARQIAFAINGADTFDEHADVATGCNTDVDASLYIPMAKRFMHNPHDFSLPAEVFKAAVITCATDADLDLGTSAVTMDSGTFYIIAMCHEESKVSLKAEDEVREAVFPTATEAELRIGGRLGELILYERGASGGVSLTGLTEVLIDGVYQTRLRNIPDLQEIYGMHRRSNSSAEQTVGDAVYSDPLANSRGIPAFIPPPGAKILDLPHLPDRAVVRLTNTGNAPTAVYRVVVPKSPSVASAVMARHGLTGNGFRVSTKGKTRRALSSWGRWSAYMPLSASDAELK